MSVRLDRIVTRGGDRGMTSLGDGARIRKDDPLIEAMGCVDELNAVVGLVRLHCPDRDELELIQNLLFDLGAVLCIPDREDDGARIAEGVIWLDAEIVALRESQQPLTSFVLPGGSVGASWAHMARVVARRSERRVVALDQTRLTSSVMFLNRVSDYFFVLARHMNDNGRSDVLWRRTQV
ncbi:cob(I)yrinic acid a,c-diamide adenosyltransferase [Asaia sp. HN010]|uniref:cob(I)yrinic acid a,c-diamide adenosyltransferase n=1 Tax=Asaia sp. HN010 TaxID=3081233 RepID=UPI003019A723